MAFHSLTLFIGNYHVQNFSVAKLKMDITDYLTSRTATVVRNPKFAPDARLAAERGFAKPNLQMDASRTMVIPPLNTNVSFSTDLPQHIRYHVGIAGGPTLPVAQPSDVAGELAAYLGVPRLPSTEDIYNPRYVHVLDNLKKNRW